MFQGSRVLDLGKTEEHFDRRLQAGTVAEIISILSPPTLNMGDLT